MHWTSGGTSSTHQSRRSFSYFFNEALLDTIAHKTNRFVVQSLAASNVNRTWETSIEKLKAYFGFMVVMGINRLPEIRHYWSSDNKHFIASRITQEKFEEISRYIHSTDNTTLPAKDEPGYCRLQKVLPIIQYLRQALFGSIEAKCRNSIDEAMIPFKGTNQTCI